jgi:Ca2+-binding RTX toxin-like protein
MSGTQKTMRRTAMLFAATLLALVVFSGVALAATLTCQAEVDCFGTKRADTLNGSEGRDFMFGKGRGDTLIGFGGTDILNGQDGADKLFGGLDNDELYGGPGNDALNGGEGVVDHYYFGASWGKDTITDSGPREGLNFVEYANGEHLPVSADLTINLNPGDGPEVKNASGTNTINWEGNLFEDVYPGSGDDQITGDSLSNEIFASEYGGADTISTGAGNDYIAVNDGAPDDVVDCGETLNNTSDDDMVLADSGDQVATNCERKINS